MLLKSLLILVQAFSLFSAFFPGTVAQTSDATCLPFYQWADNSQKQSPCQVAASLLASCNGGSYNVDALPEQHHYLGPTIASANPCQCNTVTYSLMSACGACQARNVESWSEWSTNCATVSINSYPKPIPSGTFVPGWAYFDVKTNDRFDGTLAKQNANITESTAITQPTSSSISSGHNTVAPTSTLISFSSEDPTATAATADVNSSSSTSARANAIGGGVVGGVLGFALIVGVVYFHLRRRRRRTAESGVPLPSPTATMSQYLANTVPHQMASATPSINMSTPAVYTNSSVFGSVRSMGHSNV